MNIDIQDAGTCRKKISVEYSVEDVEKNFKDAFAEVKKYAEVPGFRKGKAPLRIIERKFGERITDDVRGKLYQDGLVEALRKEELTPLGNPDVNPEDLTLTKGEEFKFSTELDVRPKFELNEYKGIELTEKIVPVTDEEIDARLEMLRDNFAEQTETDEPASEGCSIEGDVLFTIGEEEIFNQNDRVIPLTGTAVFGVEVGDVASHLSGVKAGEEKEINFTTDDNYPREELRGKDAIIKISVKKVLKRDLPEIDEDFVKRLGMDSIETLRGHFRTSLENERKSDARRGMEEELTDKLVESHSFDLPEGLIDRQAENALMQQRMQMMRMGATKDALEGSEEEMKAEARKVAETQLRRMMIIDQIADKEEITVNEADIQHHIQMLASSYGTSPAKLIQDIQKRNGVGQLQEEIRDIKITQFLLDNAEVTTEEIAAEEEGDA